VRRRDIDPAIWQDEKFGRLSIGAQLLFIWTWNDSDDWGVLRWRPERCKSGAFLYKPRINLGHVREYMAELEAQSMICAWDVSGERWAVVRMFLRWQSVNKPALSKCAAPPSDVVALLPPSMEWRSYKVIRALVDGGAPEVPRWVASCARVRSPGPFSESESESGSDSGNKEQKKDDPSDRHAPSPRKARTPKRDKPVLNMETWEWENVTDSYRKAWSEDFPGINLDDELRKARAWVRADPAKRRKKDWVRFLGTTWFKNAQERASSTQRIPIVDSRTTQLQSERAWQSVARMAAAMPTGDSLEAAMSMLPERTLDALKQWGKYPSLTIQNIGQMSYQQQETCHVAFCKAWLASEVVDKEEVES
jgi:hypothetical protein